MVVDRDLSSAGLTSLPPGVFEGLGNLQWLYVGKQKEKKKKREEGS